MATLVNPLTPRDGMVRDSASVRTFITDAGGTVTGDLVSDYRNAIATLLEISEADALNYNIMDLWKRFVEAGFPEGATGDEYFANVVFLASFDGADEATAFTEESSNAAVATFGSAAQLDTAQKMFGTASALFTKGTNDYVTFPDIGAYDLTDGDFTIEGWVRWEDIPTNSQQQSFLGQWDNADTGKSWILDLWNNSGIATWRFLHSTDGTTTIADVDIVWPAQPDTWYHFAVARDGTNLRVFIDGTQIGSTYDIGTQTLFASPDTLTLGGMNSDPSPSILPFGGWLDEVRITVGVARYTANFTAPSEAFPRSA